MEKQERSPPRRIRKQKNTCAEIRHKEKKERKNAKN